MFFLVRYSCLNSRTPVKFLTKFPASQIIAVSLSDTLNKNTVCFCKACKNIVIIERWLIYFTKFISKAIILQVQ